MSAEDPIYEARAVRPAVEAGALTLAIEAAFRAVSRLEDVEAAVRERLGPIMIPAMIQPDERTRLLEAEDVDAYVVKQIREVATRVERAVEAFTEQLSRLSL